MKNQTLAERVSSFISSSKDAFRKSLKYVYAPLALAATLSFSSPANAQTRTSVVEDFTGNAATRSYVEEHDPKWSISNERIEVQDFDSSMNDQMNSGITKRITNDQLYSANMNPCIEVDASESAWDNELEGPILIVASGAEIGENGTFYMFRANWDPSSPFLQFQVTRESPGLSSEYAHGALTSIPLGGTKRLKACRVSDGYSFSIDDTEVARVSWPSLEGYVGIGRNDAQRGSFTPTTYFDNFTVTMDAQGGGGAGRIEERVNMGAGGGVGGLVAHIPERFTRGDSNMDRALDISDGINTLNYLFLGGGNNQCPDAMDINDSGDVDLSDAVKTFNILFTGDQSLIPAPSYRNDGNGGAGPWGLADIDLTKDTLGCRGYND